MKIFIKNSNIVFQSIRPIEKGEDILLNASWEDGYFKDSGIEEVDSNFKRVELNANKTASKRFLLHAGNGGASSSVTFCGVRLSNGTYVKMSELIDGAAIVSPYDARIYTQPVIIPEDAKSICISYMFTNKNFYGEKATMIYEPI